MYLVAALAVLIVMAMALVRAFKGPTLFDHILAVNMFGTKTVILVSILGMVAGDTSYLDIALVYVLINFIGIIAVLRFVEFGQQERKAGSE